jgi:disulfide bond formation protein DsbB
MSLADKLMGATGLDSRFPEVFAAYASCADAKVDLLGLPYEFWSLGLFIVLAAAALRVVARPT